MKCQIENKNINFLENCVVNSTKEFASDILTYLIKINLI